MREDQADVRVLAKLGLSGFALTVGLPLLGCFAWLREVPIFWRNEGGYPIWLREVVLEFYYPLMALNLLVVLAYGLLLLSSPPQNKRSLGVQFAVLALMGGGLVATMLYSFADNL